MKASVKLGSYPTYTTIKIKNLSIGITYEISTQDRSNMLDLYPPFDTVLILRDADGYEIIGNDDCAYYTASLNDGWSGGPYSTPSYLTYTHLTPLYDYVYVSIYHYSSTPDCDYPAPRAYSDLFIAAVYDRDLDYFDDFYCDSPRLICKENVVKYTGGAFDQDQFLDYSNPDLEVCGANYGSYQDMVLSYNGEEVSTIPATYNDCDWLGEGKVTLGLYGEECSSSLSLLPSIQCSSTGLSQFPTSQLTRCSFTGSQCSIDVNDYPPLLYITGTSSSCYPDPSVFSFIVDPQAPLVVSIGTTANFTVQSQMRSSDGSLLTSPSIKCNVTYYGIQPSQLSRYYGGYPDLQSGDQIYFDTTYIIYYNASLPSSMSAPEIQVVLISSGPRGDQNIVDNVFTLPYAVDDSCDGDNLNSCRSYSIFCIPSDLDVEEGFYEIGLVVPKPSSTPSSQPVFNPFHFHTKRGEINDEDYIVSIGNPVVYLSDDGKVNFGELYCSYF